MENPYLQLLVTKRNDVFYFVPKYGHNNPNLGFV